MSRREERIAAIEFLYTLEVGGFYDKEEIEPDIYELVCDLISNNDEIEEIIESSMTNWKLSRLNLVDKAIIKYATYEMKFLGTPKEVAIDEALEITKIYSDIDGKQTKFTNKVLDTVANKING